MLVFHLNLREQIFLVINANPVINIMELKNFKAKLHFIGRNIMAPTN